MSPAAPRKSDRLVIGGIPRAELLPPELEIEKRARGQRRGLVTVFVLVVILVGIAYGAVTITAAAVQLALDSESARSTELLNAQNEYIEVRQLAAQVSSSESARQIGTSTEIDWYSLVAELHKRLPEGTTIIKLSVTSSTPLIPFGATVVPLEQPRVGEILIEYGSSTYGPNGDFLESLEDVPGFADASLESVKISDGLYSSIIRLHFNQEAYTNRFAEGATDTSDTQDGE